MYECNAHTEPLFEQFKSTKMRFQNWITQILIQILKKLQQYYKSKFK